MREWTLKPNETPDEVVIDWTNTPVGSVATIYLPAVSVDDILKLAKKMYTTHGFERVDDHTLRCKTGGITYMPVPPGPDVNITGLLTVDLPATVKKGQVFKIVVRQESGTEPRRVLGAFQITIPVRTKEVMLEPERRLLSVRRWIQKAKTPADRWFSVFNRYVGQIAERVRGLGGDPAAVLPWPNGDWEKAPSYEGRERTQTFTGKVEGLSYDRFGDFEGFLLDTEDGTRKFEAREREIEELVHRAWRGRTVTMVVVERDRPHRPVSIILRGMPPRFEG